MVLAFTTDAAFAQVIFQREKLTISPPPQTQQQAEMIKEPDMRPPARTSHDFMVEVRSEEALALEYIHTLNALGEKDGVMIVFAAPSLVSVPPMRVYKPVDILFISEEGEILQILPNITPAEINRDIQSPQPVSAFLYLRAGEVAARDIRPRDIVTHNAFNNRPVILQ